MQRRTFITHTAALCIAPGLVSSLLNSCKSAASFTSATYEPGIIKVPLASFAEGVQRLNVRDKRLDYDLLLIKKPENSYKAIYMKCTHEDSPVSASSTSIFCPSHGSQFDLDGNVMKDPALLPLRIYPSKVENEFIIISINQ